MSEDVDVQSSDGSDEVQHQESEAETAERECQESAEKCAAHGKNAGECINGYGHNLYDAHYLGNYGFESLINEANKSIRELGETFGLGTIHSELSLERMSSDFTLPELGREFGLHALHDEFGLGKMHENFSSLEMKNEGFTAGQLRGNVSVPNFFGRWHPPMENPFGNFNIPGISNYINSHIVENKYGKGLCAPHVKDALHKGGGLDISNLHGGISNYGGVLEKELGFTNIGFPDTYTPKEGDIAIYGPEKSHPNGHIQYFDGKNWVSDFIQDNINPNNHRKPYQNHPTIYRH